MANTSRSDHQLVRQLEAGMRNVATVDSGSKHNSQSSREDRQLMRQRGAGNRDIGNIDFGFSFPTPTRSQRSSRTPHTVRNSVGRNPRTPTSSVERQLSAPLSLKGTLTEPNASIPVPHTSSKSPKSFLRAEQPNSSKRRRLDPNAGNLILKEHVNNIPRVVDGILHSPTLTTKPSHQKHTISSGDHNDTNVTISLVSPDSPLFVPEGHDKENSTQSARRNVSASSVEGASDFIEMVGPHDKLQLTTMTEEAPVTHSIEPFRQADDVTDSAIDSIVLVEQELNSSEASRLRSSSLMAMDDSTHVSLGSNTKPSKRRKKRKSVILGRKKRRSSGENPEDVSLMRNYHTAIERSTDADLGGDGEHDFAEDATEEDTEVDQSLMKSLPLWKKLIARKAQSRRNRLSVSPSPEARNHNEQEDDESYVEEENSPEPITPAPKRKPGGVPARILTKTNARATEGYRTTQKLFPITIYRLAKTHTLPTITEQEDHCDAPSVDVERVPSTFSTRAQPNVVDVLAQICRETITSAVDKLERSVTTTTGRAELKRKKVALEAFGENLDHQLFDISQAVEHRVTLEGRLRKSKRELAELQTRWIGVRRQRDELALKADNIRRQNWENEEQGKWQWQISELGHATELAIEEEASSEADLEFALRNAAGLASTKGDRRGLLGQVKAFNSDLERIATMLEGR